MYTQYLVASCLLRIFAFVVRFGFAILICLIQSHHAVTASTFSHMIHIKLRKVHMIHIDSRNVKISHIIHIFHLFTSISHIIHIFHLFTKSVTLFKLSIYLRPSHMSVTSFTYP